MDTIAHRLPRCECSAFVSIAFHLVLLFNAFVTLVYTLSQSARASTRDRYAHSRITWWPLDSLLVMLLGFICIFISRKKIHYTTCIHIFHTLVALVCSDCICHRGCFPPATIFRAQKIVNSMCAWIVCLSSLGGRNHCFLLTPNSRVLFFCCSCF